MAGSAPTLLGVQLPDVDTWSDRVCVALGKNPGPFTGPGTNTYLIGTGPRRILLDTGQGMPEYLPVLERAVELCGCEGIQEIVLTHGHPDHIGGVRDVLDRFGPLRVSKLLGPGGDPDPHLEMEPLGDGDVLRSQGATLRAIHTPGHAPDHLCFLLEEERSLFSGDNVLGVGTTVIPSDGGDLADYLDSLERLLAEKPGAIYPAHGPRIDDGPAKLLEYIGHRQLREAQIAESLRGGPIRVAEIVARLYAEYPVELHAAAGESVTAHLRKLEREGRARRRADPDGERWSPA